MSQPFCLVREHMLGRGIHAVTLENDLMAMTLLPEKGADVYSLIYKPRSMDVLWKAPWGPEASRNRRPDAGTSEEAWMEYYSGGWQEIFPNGGDACVYKNCHLNFHGEVSVLPWEYTLEQTGEAASVEFRVTTYRSPFRCDASSPSNPGKRWFIFMSRCPIARKKRCTSCGDTTLPMELPSLMVIASSSCRKPPFRHMMSKSLLHPKFPPARWLSGQRSPESLG